LSDKGATGMTQPVLAEMLFAALNEHEATLARVSRQLHDEVSQVLSAVGLQLDAMRMDFGDAAPGVAQRAAEIQGMLEQVIDQLRDLSNELNPSIVERAGLHFALDRLAGKAQKTFKGTLRLHFDSATQVPTALAKTFYKIAECALETSLERPECSLIDIQVRRSPSEFVLEVNDNGKFMDSDSKASSLSRLRMDYYATEEHFALTMKGSVDKGNIVRASCPLSRAGQ
jgi:two-component system, NarL family, sensor histidine kinase NreB